LQCGKAAGTDPPRIQFNSSKKKEKKRKRRAIPLACMSCNTSTQTSLHLPLLSFSSVFVSRGLQIAHLKEWFLSYPALHN